MPEGLRAHGTHEDIIRHGQVTDDAAVFLHPLPPLPDNWLRIHKMNRINNSTTMTPQIVSALSNHLPMLSNVPPTESILSIGRRPNSKRFFLEVRFTISHPLRRAARMLASISPPTRTSTIMKSR